MLSSSNRNAQVGKLVAETQCLLTIGQAARGDDGFKLQEGRIKVFINYNVLKFRSMRHLGARAEKPARDRLRRIGPAVIETPFERFDRGRQNEDSNRAGKAIANLASALPVDFKQHVVALQHFVFNPDAIGAVIVAMHKRGFQKFIARFHRFKLFDRDEMVLTAVDFAGTRVARREGYGELDSRLLGEKGVDERRLPGAGRRCHQEKSAGVAIGAVGVNAFFSGLHRSHGNTFLTRDSGFVRASDRW